MLLATLLSGAMRWDILRPTRTFGDRFVLSAGHTVPLVYAVLAVLNEALRARVELDGDERFAFPDGGRWALTWEDLLTFRHRGGLPGHAEMAGKTLFFKANTGPSGHGMPVAAGEALALKLAGCEEVRVFVVEGEGGLTPGATLRDPQLGLGPGPLQPRLPRRLERLRHRSALRPPRWSTARPPTGSGPTAGASSAPSRAWSGIRSCVPCSRSREATTPTASRRWPGSARARVAATARYDAASHGFAHPLNSPEFWAVRHEFMARYGVAYEGVDQAAPDGRGCPPGAGARQLRDRRLGAAT